MFETGFTASDLSQGLPEVWVVDIGPVCTLSIFLWSFPVLSPITEPLTTQVSQASLHKSLKLLSELSKSKFKEFVLIEF